VRSRLSGPYTLTADGVANAIVEDGPGAYALGFVTSGVFTVLSVGRADTSLRTTLLQRVGNDRQLSFKCATVDSAHDAFDLECALFHEFGGARYLENKAHPERPSASRWLCPECSHFGLRDWAALAR